MAFTTVHVIDTSASSHAITSTLMAQIYIAVDVEISVPSEASNWHTKTDPQFTAFCLNPRTYLQKGRPLDSILPSIKTASVMANVSLI